LKCPCPYYICILLTNQYLYSIKKNIFIQFTIRNIFWGVGIFSCSFVGVVAGVVVVGVVVVADAVEAASDDVVCSDFAVAGKILL
jgi:hypothetical protein